MFLKKYCLLLIIIHIRYDAQLEEMLDEAYERFVTKKGGEVKQERKRAKRINPDADADLLEVIRAYFS